MVTASLSSRLRTSLSTPLRTLPAAARLITLVRPLLQQSLVNIRIMQSPGTRGPRACVHAVLDTVGGGENSRNALDTKQR
jgi:hypothetical protein